MLKCYLNSNQKFECRYQSLTFRFFIDIAQGFHCDNLKAGIKGHIEKRKKHMYRLLRRVRGCNIRPKFKDKSNLALFYKRDFKLILFNCSIILWIHD